MDKSNGNGVFASSSCHTDNAAATTTAAAALSAANNISIMNGAAAVAAAAAAAATLPASASSEDLSQSLSEYTDADESISAPTEFLAEVSERAKAEVACKCELWIALESEIANWKSGGKSNLKSFQEDYRELADQLGTALLAFVCRLIDCL